MNYKKIALVPLFLGLLGSICSCFPTSNSNPTTNSVTTSYPTSQPTSDVPTTSIETPTTTQTTTSSDPTTSKPTTSSEEISNEEEVKLNEFNDKYSMKDFFGYENKIKVEINMDKKELYQLSEDYDAYPHHSSPIYRICDVTFTINEDVVTLSKVGIRLKGNTSRRKFVDEDGNVYATVHFKLDFNEMIDYVDYSDIEKTYIDDRTFLGLKKLDLKWNKNCDSSHIKEYVALELYKEYDVKSQNIGFSQVVLNGTNLGLYYSYETIDKQFVKRYYKGDAYGGDLYKTCYTATGPADFTNVSVGHNVGEEDEDANQGNGFFPSYDIKTNKDETDHSSLKNMVKVLNNNSSKIEDIEGVVDLNQFIKYEAVSYVLGDPDDLRNNYNNSYLYFNNETKLAEILPYDKDRMFGTLCDWNPTGNGMVEANPLSNWAQGAGQEQRNPLYRKILSRPISGAETYVSTYMDLVKSIFENSETLKKFNDVYNAVKEQYEDIVIADNGLPSIEFKTTDDINLTFERYLNLKKNHFSNKYNEYKNS